jgi:hypothetical protein
MSQLLNELKETISVLLDTCNSNDTPFICANISTPDGKSKIIDSIAEIVILRQTTIGDATLLLESLYNPNILD